MAAYAGMSMFVSVLVIACGVFLTVICIVGVVKIIQIAEDLRYMRSRSDLSVQRPKTTKETLTRCGFIAGVITIVLVFSFLYLVSAASLTKAAGF